jgi:hypothetical protein
MSEKNIPDISFHLVFCFLTLRELTLIDQCSHDFRRLATKKSFIDMYSCEQFISKHSSNYTKLLIASPFRHTIKHIEFHDIFPLRMFQMVQQFSHLKKLNIKHLQYIEIGNQSYANIKPLASLQELCVVLFKTTDPPHSIDNFFQSFSLFPNLTTLDITFDCSTEVLSLGNIFSSNQFKQLEKLRFDFNGKGINSNTLSIIDFIRHLPALRVLAVDELLSFSGAGLANLCRLCAQPGAPPVLTKILISSFEVFDITTLESVAQQLQQLPKLDTIVTSGWLLHSSTPIVMIPWLRKFKANLCNLWVVDIMNLNLYNKLELIHIWNCDISEAVWSYFITKHAKSLKKIAIEDCSFYNNDNLHNLSFKILAQCTELTSLFVCNCINWLVDEFHFLIGCTKLEKISMIHCGFGENQEHALKLQSQVFPSLKVFTIY